LRPYTCHENMMIREKTQLSDFEKIYCKDYLHLYIKKNMLYMQL